MVSGLPTSQVVPLMVVDLLRDWGVGLAKGLVSRLDGDKEYWVQIGGFWGACSVTYRIE